MRWIIFTTKQLCCIKLRVAKALPENDDNIEGNTIDGPVVIYSASNGNAAMVQGLLAAEEGTSPSFSFLNLNLFYSLSKIIPYSLLVRGISKGIKTISCLCRFLIMGVYSSSVFKWIKLLNQIILKACGNHQLANTARSLHTFTRMITDYCLAFFSQLTMLHSNSTSTST